MMRHQMPEKRMQFFIEHLLVHFFVAIHDSSHRGAVEGTVVYGFEICHYGADLVEDCAEEEAEGHTVLGFAGERGAGESEGTPGECAVDHEECGTAVGFSVSFTKAKYIVSKNYLGGLILSKYLGKSEISGKGD